VEGEVALRVVFTSGKRWRMFCAVRVVVVVADIVHFCTWDLLARSGIL
jgi:hypothetical protein